MVKIVLMDKVKKTAKMGYLRGEVKNYLLTSVMDGPIGDNLRYARACSRNGNHRTMSVLFHSEIFSHFCVNASFIGQNSAYSEFLLAFCPDQPK